MPSIHQSTDYVALDEDPNVCLDIIDFLATYAYTDDVTVYYGKQLDSSNGPRCQSNGLTMRVHGVPFAHKFPSGKVWVRTLNPSDPPSMVSLKEALHAELQNAKKEIVQAPKVSVFCRNCGEPFGDHAEGKCLYDSSTFQRTIL